MRVLCTVALLGITPPVLAVAGICAISSTFHEVVSFDFHNSHERLKESHQSEQIKSTKQLYQPILDGHAFTHYPVPDFTRPSSFPLRSALVPPSVTGFALQQKIIVEQVTKLHIPEK